MVVARFPDDNQVYRAKVTAVRKGPDNKTGYDVLYIDYGNSYKDLEAKDLGRWDPAYEKIPPQAYLSSFKEFPMARKMKPDVFQKVMISQGAMKMEIFKGFPSKCGLFKASLRDFGKNVELLVSLTTKADKNVCEVLASHSAILGRDRPLPSTSRSHGAKLTASHQDLLGLRSLTVPPVKFVSAPPPLHLTEGVSHDPSPLSPPPPEKMVHSIQKVFDWDCSTSQVTDEDEVLDSEETTRRTRNCRGTLEGKVGRSLVIVVSEEMFRSGYQPRELRDPGDWRKSVFTVYKIYLHYIGYHQQGIQE